MLDKSVLEATRHLPISSLQDMSVIKITTTLCNHPQLLRLILNCDFDPNVCLRMTLRIKREWKAVLAKAKELVSLICESGLVQKQILEYIWAITYRILYWRSVYAPSIANGLLRFFYWTDKGRIDTARTIRWLIQNKNINDRKRFMLACSACLEEELREIYRGMSLADRMYFCAKNTEKTFSINLLWGFTLELMPLNYDNYVLKAMNCAVKNGMLEAVKYILALSKKHEMELSEYSFLELLSEKLELKGHLEEDENDMAYFLFFVMEDTDQERFFNTHTVVVLSLLLHSSKYNLSLTLLEERLQSHSVEDFFDFLQVIFYTYHFEVTNDDACRVLFTNVWRMLPTSMRSIELPFVRDLFPTVLIACNFSFVYDKQGLKKMDKLLSADLNSKHLINRYDFHEGKWNLLCFFIEEITTVDWLTKCKIHVLYPLNKKRSPKQDFPKLIRFVRYVERKMLSAKLTKQP